MSYYFPIQASLWSFNCLFPQKNHDFHETQEEKLLKALSAALKTQILAFQIEKQRKQVQEKQKCNEKEISETKLNEPIERQAKKRIMKRHLQLIKKKKEKQKNNNKNRKSAAQKSGEAVNEDDPFYLDGSYAIIQVRPGIPFSELVRRKQQILKRSVKNWKMKRRQTAKNRKNKQRQRSE